MTLRDFFAGIALHTELMTCGVPGDAFDALRAVCEETGIDPVDHMAGNAYELADAMLRARQA